MRILILLLLVGIILISGCTLNETIEEKNKGNETKTNWISDEEIENKTVESSEDEETEEEELESEEEPEETTENEENDAEVGDCDPETDSLDEDCIELDNDCGIESEEGWAYYECCEDSDCVEGFECVGHSCEFIEEFEEESAEEEGEEEIETEEKDPEEIVENEEEVVEEEPPETESNEEENAYPWHYNIMSTTFWFGEEPSEDNSWISNSMTAWDETIVGHYGGYDDPECREEYYPCGFVPKENPFYVALPYNDYTDEGEKKEISKQIPWYTGAEPEEYSIMKNKWVEIKYGENTCYGQIEDTGPYEEDDFEYVFGTSQPKNQVGAKAGIDISPALRTCLNREDNSYVDWKFIEEMDVPSGPWKEIITTSQINWE